MQLTLSAPAHYSLELTPLCNNRCPGCFNVFIEDTVTRPMRDVPPPLTAAQWREILIKIKPHAARVKLTGGEPTLHPEFEKIVQTLVEFDLPFSLFTNARWQHPDRLIALLSKTPQCSGLLISLHAPLRRFTKHTAACVIRLSKLSKTFAAARGFECGNQYGDDAAKF